MFYLFIYVLFITFLIRRHHRCVVGGPRTAPWTERLPAWQRWLRWDLPLRGSWSDILPGDRRQQPSVCCDVPHGQGKKNDCGQIQAPPVRPHAANLGCESVWRLALCASVCVVPTVSLDGNVLILAFVRADCYLVVFRVSDGLDIRNLLTHRLRSPHLTWPEFKIDIQNCLFK